MPRRFPGTRSARAIAAAECYNREVIRTAAEPAKPVSGIWVLKGNLCPGGAVMKPSAASVPSSCTAAARWCSNRSKICGPASMTPRSMSTNSVLVLKGCGPRGYPGMPEVGNMPLPRKLLAHGVIRTWCGSPTHA